jgi:hypothetical protein
LSGFVPRIQTLRSPFFSRTVVRVAVVIFARVSWSSFESGVVCTVSPFLVESEVGRRIGEGARRHHTINGARHSSGAHILLSLQYERHWSGALQ